MELQLLIIKQNYILTSAIATWFYSHHQLYNCEDSKTLHEVGANLRIFSERRKEKGKTDKEVCDIMSLSDAGLRSIRNRTKPLKESAS